jgi:hypothetical protein
MPGNDVSPPAGADDSVLAKWNETYALYNFVIDSVNAHKDIRMLPVRKVIESLDDLHDFVCILIEENVVKADKVNEWTEFANMLITLRFAVMDYDDALLD